MYNNKVDSITVSAYISRYLPTRTAELKTSISCAGGIELTIVSTSCVLLTFMPLPLPLKFQGPCILDP